jgi:transcriptional regulator with XRE-family HTH domain
MSIKVKIGAQIKALRTSKNLSQEEVALNADLERSFIAHVENGRRNVTIETLEKIVCNGLQTSFKDFFNAKEFKNS